MYFFEITKGTSIGRYHLEKLTVAYLTELITLLCKLTVHNSGQITTPLAPVLS
jgi:hypothetical protein